MLDTMTATKIVGALCGSLLVFLLGGWAGELLFHTGGHGDGHEQAYSIEVETGDEEAVEVEAVDFVALVAAADAGAGERVFGKCKACHKMDGSDGTGPHLNGVVGREIASIGGFGYSDALVSKAGAPWDADALNGFLESPKGWAPGTKMTFAGLRKVSERADLVAYLQGTN